MCPCQSERIVSVRGRQAGACPTISVSFVPQLLFLQHLFIHMRIVVQRVSSASVTVDCEVVGQIERGFVVFLGITGSDTRDDVNYLTNKLIGLRVFEDADGKMNCSIVEDGGSMLVISQFTLFGDCRKGRRPSFIEAARPEVAKPLYEGFVAELRAQGIATETGRFQKHMDVTLVNDGPVTLLLDSRKEF